MRARLPRKPSVPSNIGRHRNNRHLFLPVGTGSQRGRRRRPLPRHPGDRMEAEGTAQTGSARRGHARSPRSLHRAWSGSRRSGRGGRFCRPTDSLSHCGSCGRVRPLRRRRASRRAGVPRSSRGTRVPCGFPRRGREGSVQPPGARGRPIPPRPANRVPGSRTSHPTRAATPVA